MVRVRFMVKVRVRFMVRFRVRLSYVILWLQVCPKFLRKIRFSHLTTDSFCRSPTRKKIL